MAISQTKFEYDLAIAYRICPKLSKTTAGLPIGSDKFDLVRCCLKSFVLALGSLRCKIWGVLDGCPPQYAALCEREFAGHQLALVETPGIGNRSTFDRQIDILATQCESDIVYFAEDDYLYQPDCFPRMINFLRNHPDCDFVSGYDHPDCYTLDLHHYPKWLSVFDGHHWRTAGSTCLTFMTTRSALKSAEGQFRTYGRGNCDASLWLTLTKPRTLNPTQFMRYLSSRPWLAKIVAKAWAFGFRQILLGPRYSLWVPVPGFATHLDAQAMSPGIDWNSQMTTLYSMPDEDIHPCTLTEGSIQVGPEVTTRCASR